MKKLFTLLVVLLYFYGSSQTTNVTYTISNEVIANPERGFYHHKETSPSGYSSLSQSSLTNYRLNEKVTQILRLFYLNDFINSPISGSYLANMQADFNKIRNAGLKCIVRFAYSNETNLGQRDASKTQMLAHIAQIKPYLENNADVISVMQAGFIGTWGEWYYTDHFGMAPTTADYANRKEIVDALLDALPTSRMVQIRTPKMKQKTFLTTTALTANQAFTETDLSRLGHHNDCFLSSASDVGTYTNISTEYPYLEQETKFLPMGGESCDMNSPRTDCPTALLEMAKFHWSYLNLDYYPAVIDGFVSGDCYSVIQNKLGYRFELKSAQLPQSVAIGSTFPITLNIKNTGFASPYNERKAYIVMKNVSTNQVYQIEMNADPRLWLGPNELAITENLTLPANIIPGSYSLYLNLPDAASNLSTRPEYSIRFANLNTWDATTGYNNLNFIMNVGQALGVADNDRVNPIIYPVPANNELIVEMNNIADYTISIYNTLGQKFNLVSTINANKMTINTDVLSDGVYLLQFDNGQTRDTKRIIVKH
jgi:hypothetical protein